MPISLQIDEPYEPFVKPELIETAVTAALEFGAQPPNALVTVVITSTEQVRELNQHYRGFDAPTDVLSFENSPDPDFPADPTDEESGYLGDVIIAYPVAEAQALAAQHPPADEVVLLTVHGVLHLLGFDHDTAERKAAMWQAQGQIMTGLGLGHIQPTET